MIDWNRITVLSIERLYTVPSIKGMNAHIDRDCYGLSFSYSGRITYSQNGTNTVSDHTNAVLLPKGSYELYREESGNFPVINFTCADGILPDTFVSVPLRNPNSYLKDYERMYALQISGSNPAKLMSIFYAMLSNLSDEDKTKSSAHSILSPAMDYMAKHIFDPDLCNSRLAAEANISEVYFRKLFMQAYGTSPKQYIIDARISHAKNLLSERAATVSTIAEACGFSGLYHFSRAFKLQTGQTPSEFIKQS